MTMAISALPKLAKTDLTAAPASSADGTSFAAMLGGAAPVSAADAPTASATAAPAGKTGRMRDDAVDPSLVALMAVPVPVASPAPALPAAPVSTDAGQGASSPALPMPASAAPAPTSTTQPAALTPEEMAALAPALQLLAAHGASENASPSPVLPQAPGQPEGATSPSITTPVSSDIGQTVVAQPAAAPPTSRLIDQPRPDAAPQPAPRTPEPQAASDTAAILSARAGATKATARAATPADTAPSAAVTATATATGSVTTVPIDANPGPDLRAAKPVVGTTDAAPAQAVQMSAAQARSTPSDDRADRPSPRRTDKAAAVAASADGATVATVAAAATPAAAPAPTSTHSAMIDTAGQQLAQGGADRALDLAKGNAWLDGLSRDIAATGDAKGTLNFQVAPQQLGLVSVAVKQGEDGASVLITAASEKARDLIADARPQLIAEAQANGLRIASAQVDVSTQQQAADQGRNGQQQQGGHPSHQQGSQQPAQAGGGFSAQAGMGGDDGRSSQTRYQPLSDTPLANPFRGGAPADSVDDASPADGLYA